MRNTPELRVRAATFDRGQADPARRTVPASLSSEEPVARYGETEVLRHDPAAVDLSRAAGGLPLLFGHDKTQPIGVVENVRLDGRRLVGVLRFGQSAKATEVWNDVQDGVLRHVSIGYLVEGTEPIDGGYAATRWMPFEASVLAVPADITVGIGRGASHLSPEGTSMSETQTRDADVAEIRSLAARHHLPAAFADDLVQRQLSLDEARHRVLDELGRRDLAAGGHLNVARDSIARDPSRGGLSTEAQRELMVGAVAARLGGPAVERENPYRHARMVDLARDCLETHGVRTTFLAPGELIERALHTTSDFPNLLGSAGNRVLRQAYNVAPGIKRAFKPSTSADFRAKQRLALGDAPTLLQVNEHGEFKSGTMAETNSTYSLGTFGRIFGISRQALINDDLDAFGDMIIKLGRASNEFESQFLVDLLTSNPSMYDAVALFHATHGNLATGAGSALQFSSLSAARQAMRLQKGLDGKTPIDATPHYLIVPAALESTAEQLVAVIVANAVTSVNPFAGKLDLVVDPRLDAVSQTAWYLAADSGVVDTIEYSYLESAGGPEIFTKEGFEVDGMQMKVRLDFGAGVLDWRGLYRANGA
jgi:hypothetical protein